ncbi:MAG: hypothetical protein LUC20_00330 [Oscillospiraceae bacterium]|nr:hypothetical protein [Oscillospiraceae bacterium]
MLYSNWLNYIVYQNTPYEVESIGYRHTAEADTD